MRSIELQGTPLSFVIWHLNITNTSNSYGQKCVILELFAVVHKQSNYDQYELSKQHYTFLSYMSRTKQKESNLLIL